MGEHQLCKLGVAGSSPARSMSSGSPLPPTRRRRGGRGSGGCTVAHARLRESGFTHVMFCPPVPESAVEFDPTLGRLLEPWLAGHTPVFREDLTDGDGVLRRYSIYELTDDQWAAQSSTGVTR